MGIKGSVLHDNVLGNTDTERGEVPYGLDTALYHGIRYLLGYFDRYRQHAYIDIVLLHLLLETCPSDRWGCRSVSYPPVRASHRKAATISKTENGSDPSRAAKAPPKLPTPNRKALCILVKSQENPPAQLSVCPPHSLHAYVPRY